MTRSSLAVIGLFCLIYLLPLGFRPMTVPDESRYSEIPREMIASGDWVVPRLNGVLYFEKPVMGYWVNAVSIGLFGQNRFSIRLPSALATGLTALMLFFLVRRFSRENPAPAALLACAAYLTCLLVFALGVINILDSLLTLFLTGAMVAFFYANHAGRGGRSLIGLAVFGGFCGLAFLVKGFLAFVVPIVTVVPFVLWERRMKSFLKLSWIPVLTAVLVVMPWAVMIHLREGDFWNYFFWTEHIRRFLSPIPGQHPEPFWYYLPVLMGGALPWVVLAPAAVLGLGRRWRDAPIIRFLLCWFFFPLLFFSASSGKLIPYVIPCFPPLVVLIAIGVTNYLASGRRKAFDLAALLLGVALGVFALGFVFAQVTGFWGSRMYEPWEWLKWVGMVLGVSVWSVITLLSLKQDGFKRKLVFFCVAPVLVFFSSHMGLPNRALEGRAPQALLERNTNRVGENAVVVSDEYLFHAVCWFYDRDDVHLLKKAGELAYGLEHAPDGTARRFTLDRFRKLIEQGEKRPRVILIVEADRYLNYVKSLPPPVFEDRDNGVMFLVY